MAQRFVCRTLTLFLLVAAATSRTTATAIAQAQDEASVYEAFRSWLNSRPPLEQKGADETIFERYRAKLRAEGVAPAEVDRRIAILRERGSRLEIERWNRILTAGTPQFNTEPNAFLVEMIRGRQPGTALDVGMDEQFCWALSTRAWARRLAGPARQSGRDRD